MWDGRTILELNDSDLNKLKDKKTYHLKFTGQNTLKTYTSPDRNTEDRRTVFARKLSFVALVIKQAENESDTSLDSLIFPSSMLTTQNVHTAIKDTIKAIEK